MKCIVEGTDATYEHKIFKELLLEPIVLGGMPSLVLHLSLYLKLRPQYCCFLLLIHTFYAAGEGVEMFTRYSQILASIKE